MYIMSLFRYETLRKYSMLPKYVIAIRAMYGLMKEAWIFYIIPYDMKYILIYIVIYLIFIE
jgi:hypothetical protein